MPLPIEDRRAVDLDRVTIPSPCAASWEAMAPDERATRHCERCDTPVHDLAQLSRDEAERLLGRPGHLCVRITRRADGSVVTREPLGWRARAWRGLRRAAGLLVGVGVALGLCACDPSQGKPLPGGWLQAWQGQQPGPPPAGFSSAMGSFPAPGEFESGTSTFVGSPGSAGPPAQGGRPRPRGPQTPNPMGATAPGPGDERE